MSDVPRDDSPFAVPLPRLTQPGALSAKFSLSLDAGIALNEPVVGLHAPPVPRDVVKDLARETIGRGKVDRGLVHPYYSQLGKVLLKNWDADRAVSANGLKGLTEQWGENTRLYNEIWQQRAAQFGATGAPTDAPAETKRGRAANERAPITGIDRQASKAMNETFKATRRAHIRVEQAADGKLLSVELLKPSNDANVDRQAVVDVRAAAEKLPPPPPEALQGKDTLVSIWEFELVVSITPPVPVFTFEFDEVIGFIDARLPLDRRIYKKVRLYAIE